MRVQSPRPSRTLLSAMFPTLGTAGEAEAASPAEEPVAGPSSSSNASPHGTTERFPLLIGLHYCPLSREEEEAINEMRRSSSLTLYRTPHRVTREGVTLPNNRVTLFYDENTLRIRLPPTGGNPGRDEDYLIFAQNGAALLDAVAPNARALREETATGGPLYVDFLGPFLFAMHRVFANRRNSSQRKL